MFRTTKFRAAQVSCALSILIGPLHAAIAADVSDASAATQSINDSVKGGLPFSDRSDFEDARRGLVAELAPAALEAPDGRTAWNAPAFGFVKGGEAPATVNPSLWRMGNLNSISGLFKVAEGFYQVRGADLANMTIIEGKTGIIVIDSLMSTETATAALDFYFTHRPKRPVNRPGNRGGRLV